MPTNVLIAGGGPAALEAALRLRRVGSGLVATTLLAPEADFTYRPLSVLDPFAAGGAPAYPLTRVAADAGAALRPGTLASVDAAAHVARTAEGDAIPYDVLLVAVGAVATRPFELATTFTGGAREIEAVHGLVQDVEGGYTRRTAFVVPDGATWPLPLYELALMLADRAYEMGVDTRAALHHARGGAARGVRAGRGAGGGGPAGRGRDRRARRHARGARGARRPDPRRRRPARGAAGRDAAPARPARDRRPAARLPGHRRARAVDGVPDVYAAGDITAHAVKQGGLACQQADAAADHIAARAGARLVAQPYRPVLLGVLKTVRATRFLRREPSGESRVAAHPLWAPPAKIAGVELAAYLESLKPAAVS